MDSPLVSFELKEKYLLVIGHGKRDNLTSMAAPLRKSMRKSLRRSIVAY
jgi:hypothetical protein